MIIFGIEITKREIIASITILSLMTIFGILITNKFYENSIDKVEQYNKAIKINDDTNLFVYGMETNVGNALVYGQLTYDDAMTFDEIGGKYIYVEKVTEEYTQHTRVVSRTNSEGKTETYTETYYSWDIINTEAKHSEKVSFCKKVFDYEIFENAVSKSYIKTKYKKRNLNIRYVYYGYKGTKGTSFCNLKNNTIDNIRFYNNSTIEQTIDKVSDFNKETIVFWIFWVLLTGFIIYKFYSLENKWLN